MPPTGSTLPTLDVAARADRVRSRFAAHGCSHLVVTAPVDVRYLTGFAGSAGAVVVRPDDLVVITDGRYREQAAEQAAAAAVAVDVIEDRDIAGAVARLMGPLDRIGVQADDLRWADAERWRATLGARVVPTEALLLECRSHKEVGEVARLEAASTIADAALAAVRGNLSDGPTEREFAHALETAMHVRGSEAPSFPTIVASGPNASRPHAAPTDRTIGSSGSETVIIDFGATVDGYHSDVTRTLVVGEPTDEVARLIGAVTAAHRAGADAVAPGVAAADVDAAARQTLADHGLADAFVHGTGHGIGLEIHEHPRISAKSEDRIEVGHVVTVEPGAYLPGTGGVRIEDSYAVGSDSVRRITSSPYDLDP